jgi:hypothetical protein
MSARFARKSAHVAFARGGVLFIQSAVVAASLPSRVALTRSRRAVAGGQSKPI